MKAVCIRVLGSIGLYILLNSAAYADSISFSLIPSSGRAMVTTMNCSRLRRSLYMRGVRRRRWGLSRNHNVLK